MTPSGISVLLVGATGLLGSECLKLLAGDSAFSRVTALTRRPVESAYQSRVEYFTVNFDDPDSFRPFLNVDKVICSLGTTIRTAGSQNAFRKVDHDYPLMIGKLARQSGARHFLLVSSMGADASSRIFYSRVKGEIEAALSSLDYPALTIFRPSLLLGHRLEFRLGEFIGQSVLGTFRFLLPRRIRPVRAREVAAAIVHAAKADTIGIHVIRNEDML